MQQIHLFCWTFEELVKETMKVFSLRNAMDRSVQYFLKKRRCKLYCFLGCWIQERLALDLKQLRHQLSQMCEDLSPNPAKALLRIAYGYDPWLQVDFLTMVPINRSMHCIGNNISWSRTLPWSVSWSDIGLPEIPGPVPGGCFDFPLYLYEEQLWSLHDTSFHSPRHQM